jgi:chromosome partitioning protein
MRTLAFSSIKGGVGKTTLAVHVAAGLADSGKKTLLVDLDPQGHASMMAGVEITPSDPCVADAFGMRPSLRLDQIIQASPRPNLKVAPASVRMIELERELFRWGHRLQAIPRALRTYAEEFEAVVIDTPPQLNAYSEAALAIGDLVVVPLPAMAHALQGLDEIMLAWQDVSDGHGGKMVGAVNMWDRRTSATNAAMEEAFNDLDIPITKNRVSRAESLNQAGLAYELIYDFSATSPAAEDLRGLSSELWRIAGRAAS